MQKKNKISKSSSVLQHMGGGGTNFMVLMSMKPSNKIVCALGPIWLKSEHEFNLGNSSELLPCFLLLYCDFVTY